MTVERTILQPGTSDLQALCSAAANVMAAVPHEPSKLALHYHSSNLTIGMTPETQHLPLVRGAGQNFAMSIYLPPIMNTRSLGQSVSKHCGITLPGLEFLTTDFGVQQETRAKNVLNVVVVLWTNGRCMTGTAGANALAQAKDLCDAVRAIIAPILGGRTPTSMDSFTKECKRAILRSEQPLAGLLSAKSVDVKVSTLRRGSEERSLAASATLPGLSLSVPCSRRKYIALGSNVGDRIEAIESACRTLDMDADICVAETSPLYETDPMYVEDQARFLNGVCEVCISSIILPTAVPR